ncbi:cold shock and DUF1294 domain-containing protein [Vibrio mediterranei]|uniref:DUF1294 domain-containing protein n=3 Tax=Vibrio mediterranei TaxID=689 RepID=UPI001EFE48D6|nr:cold shock and DUF1294 domain-containing protein [Vibrio mediterranei]MCG9629106.1 cold shock and DUF1294 domain-containing protein [Vibrio mediterranei]
MNHPRSMMKGHIAQWDDEKGYGFIIDTHSRQRVFFHISDVQHRRRPQGHETVRFLHSQDAQGRPRAIRVNYDSPILPHHPLRTSVVWGIIGYAALLFYTVNHLLWVLLPYLGISLLTYRLFALDKHAAITQRWRIPENTLLLFSLLGGWPGALLAQQSLKHKSQKSAFKTQLYFVVGLNVALYALLSSDAATQTIQTFIQYDASHALMRFRTLLSAFIQEYWQ